MKKNKLFSYPKDFRLLSSVHFNPVEEKNDSFTKGKILGLVSRPNSCNHGRLGIKISKKHGNAVSRNRFKRLIREFFRKDTSMNSLPKDYIVIRANFGKNSNTKRPKYTASIIASEMSRVLR